MAKITKLPPELEARLPEIRDDWIRVGLSCEPADVTSAEEAIDEVYKTANLQPPKIKMWLPSPLQGACGSAILVAIKDAKLRGGTETRPTNSEHVRVFDTTKRNVLKQCGDQIAERVVNALRASGSISGYVRMPEEARKPTEVLCGGMLKELREKVLTPLATETSTLMELPVATVNKVFQSVSEQLATENYSRLWGLLTTGSTTFKSVGEGTLWHHLKGFMGKAMKPIVGVEKEDLILNLCAAALEQFFADLNIKITSEDIRKQIWAAGYGQHDANWLGWGEVFKGLVPEADRLIGLQKLARASGWWWPFNHGVILTDRPKHLKRDAQNRLHCGTTSALAYRDDWGVYAWHGLRVPQKYVEERDKITKKMIMAETNSELRRALCEIIGWDKAFEILGGQEVHKDEQEVINPFTKEKLKLPRRLVEVDLGDGRRVRLLQMSNGTLEHGERRQFIEGVPVNINTCKEAEAWQMGVSPKLISDSVRT